MSALGSLKRNIGPVLAFGGIGMLIGIARDKKNLKTHALVGMAVGTAFAAVSDDWLTRGRIETVGATAAARRLPTSAAAQHGFVAVARPTAGY
jgi:hypothetical protein